MTVAQHALMGIRKIRAEMSYRPFELPIPAGAATAYAAYYDELVRSEKDVPTMISEVKALEGMLEANDPYALLKGKALARRKLAYPLASAKITGKETVQDLKHWVKPIVLESQLPEDQIARKFMAHAEWPEFQQWLKKWLAGSESASSSPFSAPLFKKYPGLLAKLAVFTSM